MIFFNSETDFTLNEADERKNWLEAVALAEGYSIGELNIIFSNDEYVHKLNKEFLDHDELTDVISFDYSVGKELHGDIYISIQRVDENALIYETGFQDELNRVMVHGLLHFCGYSDKDKADRSIMRNKEDQYLGMLGLKS